MPQENLAWQQSSFVSDVLAPSEREESTRVYIGDFTDSVSTEVRAVIGRKPNVFKVEYPPAVSTRWSIDQDLLDASDIPPLSPSEIENDLFRLHRKFHIEMDPVIFEYFQNGALYNSLRAAMKGDDVEMSRFISNTSRFNSLIQDQALYGREMVIAHGFLENGTARREEMGKVINLAYLREKWVDPSKVLFFRVTQPGWPKPEYYWTTDMFEVFNGLRQEISPEKRKSSVILVSSLEHINTNGGLIRDVNDDGGLAVRQIGIGNFSQNDVLAVIRSGE